MLSPVQAVARLAMAIRTAEALYHRLVYEWQSVRQIVPEIRPLLMLRVVLPTEG